MLAESCKFHSKKILAPKNCMKEIIKAQDLDAISFVGDSFGDFFWESLNPQAIGLISCHLGIGSNFWMKKVGLPESQFFAHFWGVNNHPSFQH